MKSNNYLMTWALMAGVMGGATKELVAGHAAHLPPAGVFSALAVANSSATFLGTGVHFSALSEAEYLEPPQTAVLKNDSVTVRST